MLDTSRPCSRGLRCRPNHGWCGSGSPGPPAEVTAYYRQYFAPVIATFAGLDPDRAAALERELVDLYAAEDTGPAGGPSCYELEYLLVRVHRPAPVDDRVPASRAVVRPAPARPPAAAPMSRAASRLLGDEVHLLLRGLHPGVHEPAEPVGDPAELADGGVVDRRLRRADHRDPRRRAVVALRDADGERLARVGVPRGVVVAQPQQGAVEAGDVAVELQLCQVVVGEDLRPAGEAPRVGDERTGPQRLDQGGVGSRAGERADQVLAALQRRTADRRRRRRARPARSPRCRRGGAPRAVRRAVASATLADASRLGAAPMTRSETDPAGRCTPGTARRSPRCGSGRCSRARRRPAAPTSPRRGRRSPRPCPHCRHTRW